MRLVSLSLVMSVSVAACTPGSSGVGLGLGADGGSGDAATAAPSSCTPQPESVRLQFCDATKSNELVACDEGSQPPSADCTKTVQTNAYCCPSDGPVATDAGTDSPSGSAVNPYGVPYPTTNIGWKARAGASKGDRIANVSLQGYGPSSATLGTVSLAALYDPQGKTHDVVFIVAGAQWDTYSKVSLDTIHGSTKRIATLAVLGEGTSPGTAATLGDLSKWRTAYPWATTVLDAGFAVFGAAFDASALPFVMVIDARTMEIASASVGAVTTGSQVDALVSAVTSRPPAY